jgi:alkanesulfonate monooxygenase SsuD/methylene tetrahydromethanopterin reductase-like flavin-dependent oxidoreductase (luciferase family)
MKVGLVIRLAELPETKKAPSYAEIRETARQAEDGGFDSIWLYDHLLYRNEGTTTGIWECWTMMSALAEATQRVQIGSLVLCNSFRNPAILAKMASTLDEVSAGRYILGIGAGWNEPEYDAFGLPFDHRVDRFEEALQIICPLLREGWVDFEGKYYQARDCEITPRGPSPNGPPVLIGGGRPRMLRLIAQYADQWNIGYFGEPEGYVEWLDKIREACADTGRDPETLEKTVMLFLRYPDLGGPAEFTDPHLTGSGEEIAEALRGYERLGVGHVMFHLVPHRQEAWERAIEAVQVYRQAS